MITFHKVDHCSVVFQYSIPNNEEEMVLIPQLLLVWLFPFLLLSVASKRESPGFVFLQKLGFDPFWEF